jgi:hypothetical protein
VRYCNTLEMKFMLEAGFGVHGHHVNFSGISTISLISLTHIMPFVARQFSVLDRNISDNSL